jgi:hypothetical protein
MSTANGVIFSRKIVVLGNKEWIASADVLSDRIIMIGIVVIRLLWWRIWGSISSGVDFWILTEWEWFIYLKIEIKSSNTPESKLSNSSIIKTSFGQIVDSESDEEEVLKQ